MKKFMSLNEVSNHVDASNPDKRLDSPTWVINMTQHTLMEEQEAALSDLADRDADYEGCYSELKDLNPELFARLANSPSDSSEVTGLAEDAVRWMEDVSNTSKLYVVFHLPIGSPAVMAAMFRKIGYYELFNSFGTVFSHSERVSYEKDGVKTSFFKFANLITL